MTFTVDRLDHVEVYVRDIESACSWYEQVLGLKEIYRWDPEPVMIGAGGTKLALFKAAASPASEGWLPLCRWHRVAWQTDGAGFEAAQQHLATLRITFRGPVDHVSARSIYFHDPDGNLLEITHYLAAV